MPLSLSSVLDVVFTTSMESARVNSSKVDPMGDDQHLGTDTADDAHVEDSVLDALDVAQPTKARLLQQIATRAMRKARESEVEQRFISLLPPAAQETARASSDIYEALSKAIHDDGGGGELSKAELRQDQRFQKLEAMMAKNSELLLAKQEEATRLQEALCAKQEEASRLQVEMCAKQEEANRLQEQVLHNQEEMKQMQRQVLGQLAVLQSRVQAVLTQTYELHEYPIPRLFVVLPQDPSGWDSVNVFANKFRLYFLCECGEHTKSINSTTRIPHHIHLAKHEGYEITRPSEFFQQYGTYVLTILKMLKYGVTVAGIVIPAFAQLISPEVLGQTIHGLKVLQDTMVPGVDQVIRWMDSDEDMEEITGQVESKEALEGADLRMLDTFLKDKDGNKVLGNLYRTVTDEGHVKWVCIDHYRMNYQENTAKEFVRVLEAVGGSFSENLDLRGNSIGEDGAKALAEALKTNSTLATLDLRGNSMRLNSLLAFLELLKTNITLTTLNLRSSSIRDTLALRVNLSLTVLNLKYSNIGAIGAKALAETLTTNSTLTILDLRNNSIRDDGAKAIAEALKTNSTLTTLDLRDNSVGDDGAKALAEALKTNLTLVALDLTSNEIERDGAKALAEALKINSTLTTLSLWNNSIGDDGATALAEALKINSTLTILDLSGSLIGDDGAEALAEGLKTNMTLVTLDLRRNPFGGEGATAIAQARETNSTVNMLYN
ncbi:hypothetical protein BGZ75_005491 [Mortierella antarctica]|nr:hypothetical protein BGZ75_005491 [Mortierella antarctica]